ncbi:hypothetical protein Gpo141_00001923 [Globisporangium polare]
MCSAEACTLPVPQQPDGWAKRVAYTVDNDASSTITSLAGVTSCGSNKVGYNADTAGGTSRSPVLSATDNLVVALHHCDGWKNTAVNVLDILKDPKYKAISVANISTKAFRSVSWADNRVRGKRVL